MRVSSFGTSAVVSFLLVVVGACGGSTSDSADAAPPFSTGELDGVSEVTEAVGGNLAESAPMTVVVAIEGGGLASFVSNEAGELEPSATALADETVTGLAVAQLENDGPSSIVALTAGGTLYALDGTDLGVRWSADGFGLTTNGDIVPGDMDGDGDDDIAAYAANNTEVVLIETGASQWTVRGAIPLFPGIASAAAGDLGGNKHAEYLLIGDYGIIEVLTDGDFNYGDIRMPSFTPSAQGVFGDFTRDGNRDVAVSTGDEVELWRGDGVANLTLVDSLALGSAAIQHMVALPGGAGGRLAVVLEDGSLHAVTIDGQGSLSRGADEYAASGAAFRILAGDLDGDGATDVVVVTADGKTFTWRDPQ
jgi:hypothetical protein